MNLLALEPGFSFGGPLDRIFPEEIFRTQRIVGPSPQEKGGDRFWMLEALRESLLGIGISNPNPSVGCVIVDPYGQEISRGATQAYPGLHAERVAFDKIKDKNRFEGATAYVSLEPCSHKGNQPPCVDLLVSSKIRRIVIARGDPNPLINGKGIQKLKDAGKEVEIGLFAAEATAWNFPFFAYQTFKRPIIILKWAQTLDGQLADDSQTSQWITGPAARAYTHWLRQRYDAILVGAGTVLADNPRLSARDCALPHQANPLPIIFDPRGTCLKIEKHTQLKLSSGTFIANRPLVYITTETVLREHPGSWLEQKKEILILTLQEDNLIPDLIKVLGSPKVSDILGHGLQSIMIEGGPKTITSFLKAGYADLLHVFIAPKLTGGTQNRVHVSHLLKDAQNFELVSTSRLGSDLVMEMVSSEAMQRVF